MAMRVESSMMPSHQLWMIRRLCAPTQRAVFDPLPSVAIVRFGANRQDTAFDPHSLARNSYLRHRYFLTRGSRETPPLEGTLPDSGEESPDIATPAAPTTRALPPRTD